MDKATSDPLIGKTVAQYEIAARLGGGGMGVVYAARDTKLERQVALKFLPPQWSRDEGAKQRFIREAQAASATDHRNICTIHDIGTTDDGQLFIVMAHYGGQTLKQRLDAGALPVEEAVEIAAQAAEGLAKAHAQGVVHRDIKPGNLMLAEDEVKILDFGLAKFAESRLKLTLEGSTIGTIAYMSPEQARGEEADARSDVWAVGVVLYEMLAGEAPFKGAYPEAVAHAIKNDPPPPLRGYAEPGQSEPLRGPTRDDIPEALEQLVFRALHKSPAVRFQTARDLARALRQLQGKTVPLDLRTEPVRAGDAVPDTMAPRRRWTGSRAIPIAAALLVVVVGAGLWVFAPVERLPVAVAPVANQTGFAELDPYRLALTQELTAQLADSRIIRVLPYDRLLQIVRRFRQGEGDVSSREAMQALAKQSGARVIIVPTLTYENRAWRARAEFRNAETATNEGTSDTEPVVSSLVKDAAYGLIATLSADIETHFLRSGTRRAYLASVVRRIAGRAPSAPLPRMRSLDASAAFERGIDAYEQQEYSAALASFAMAAELDSLNPLPLAWQSRVARMMRRSDEMAEAAEAAARLLTDQSSALDRLFVDAVATEARRDTGAAEALYRELATRAADEPRWRLELAGFLDRELRPAEAITTYHDALALDGRLARPHLELCRLYNPNELASAREHGELALAAYRALGGRAGEAQARWCLADILRVGDADEVMEARRHADTALGIVEGLGYDYNLGRARYYVALVAAFQGNLPEAASELERALALSRTVGNRELEPLLLMNLGVAQMLLGNRAQAADYYAAGAKLFEALGNQRRAAEQQANGAALRIEFGNQPALALRDMQNALAVVQELGDKNFEAFCRQVIAAYYRQIGQHANAERELNLANAILLERNIEDDIASVTVDQARSKIELGEYPAAMILLKEVLGDGTGPQAAAARIHLARLLARLGDTGAAASQLETASADVSEGDELFPLLLLARGEVAYEAGRPSEAQSEFARAAALWTGELPDVASVEAQALVGFFDAGAGSVTEGTVAIEASLKQAEAMERMSLEARRRLQAPCAGCLPGCSTVFGYVTRGVITSAREATL